MSWRSLVRALPVVAVVLVPLPAAGRVLPAAAAPVLKQAFESVRSCRIDEIRVERRTASIRLCLRVDTASCFSAELTDPTAGCDGEESGPWCLRWSGGEPPGEVRDAVRQALRASDDVWISPDLGEPRAERHLSDPDEEAVPGRLRPLALALVLVAAPGLAGIALGRALRGSPWRWLWLAAAAAPIALSSATVDLLPRFGAWDVLSVGALLGAGVVGGAARVDRRNVLLLFGASAIALGGLEWGVRRWLPQPPQFPPPEDASFIVKPGGWDSGCSVLYGPAGVDRELRYLHAGPERESEKNGPLVVHLGDSMTFGTGVREAEAFPALLDARQADVVHANYGVWAVGTDFQYVLLQKVLAVHAAATVVLHVYVGNDVFEIDRPYECCEAGPLLEYAPGGPTARCPTARWRFTLASRLGRSPPPFPLRVATAWSYTARHAAGAFARLAFQLDLPPHFIRTEGEASEDGWAHFAQILGKMRDQLGSGGSAFIVDLLPSRRALESTDPTEMPSYRTRRRVATITAQLGIKTLDAWDLFAAAVQRDGSRRYFLEENDIHFTPEGHRLLADWLEGQLPPHGAALAQSEERTAANETK